MLPAQRWRVLAEHPTFQLSTAARAGQNRAVPHPSVRSSALGLPGTHSPVCLRHILGPATVPAQQGGQRSLVPGNPLCFAVGRSDLNKHKENILGGAQLNKRN